MSKHYTQSYFKFLLLLLALQIFTEARAQHIAVEMSVDAATRKTLVKLRFEDGFRPESEQRFAFRPSVAGNSDLSRRVSDVRFTHSGDSFDITSWEYSVDLTPPPDRAAAAHASWLTTDGGVLMLDDLLPIFDGDRKRQRVTLALRLPNGWRSYSADDAGGKDFYDVRNLEGSVIFVGTRFRELTVKAKSATVSLLLAGRWNFSDAEAAKATAEIYDAYVRLLGPLPANRSLVALTKFPQGESAGQWEAETRGSTVLIASSDVPFTDRSYQRMHEQLRHEIFHLWFPNSVNLTGDYAWFYEGMALYQSLKLGVALRKIEFSDFLDTMSRALTIERGAGTDSQWRRSFTQQHYARSMVIAFLLDLQIMQESNGAAGSDIGLKEIVRLRKHSSTAVRAEDEILTRFGIRTLFVDQVFNGRKYDPNKDLQAAGLIAISEGSKLVLSVVSRPSDTQKALLKRLGYN